MDWVDFAAVKQAVSLETVLQHYQWSGLYRQRRQQLAGRCPIHRGQRDDSFGVQLAKGVFHCFACQAGGNVLDLVAAMEKCSIREAALKLQRWFAVPDRAHPAGLGPAREPNAELVRKKQG